jgi:hypothetical protein
MMLQKPRPPADPTRKGQPRHYCRWIADPFQHRCPRLVRTGQECWCRDVNLDYDRDWPWSVVPPLVFDPAEPAWLYEDYGPVAAPAKGGA